MDVESSPRRDGDEGITSDVLEPERRVEVRNIDQKQGDFDQKSRSKTSLRIRYEAEVQVIRRKLGSLEAIRGQLGLSQRKLCQLLLVDPSAWSRWVRANEDAPPHIYRMLQWYLALQEKYPALDVNFWLSTVSRAQEPLKMELREARLAEIPGKVEALSAQLTELRAITVRQKRLIVRLTVLSILAALLSVGLLTVLIIRP